MWASVSECERVRAAGCRFERILNKFEQVQASLKSVSEYICESEQECSHSLALSERVQANLSECVDTRSQSLALARIWTH